MRTRNGRRIAVALVTGLGVLIDAVAWRGREDVRFAVLAPTAS